MRAPGICQPTAGTTTAWAADLTGGMSASRWDALAGSHFYSTSGWLRFCADDVGARQGALVRGPAARPVAAVPVAELTAPPPALYRWGDLLDGYSLPRLRPGGLLVGPRIGYQTHLLVAAGADRTQAAGDLVAEIRELHRTVGGPAHGSCVAMYVTTEDARAVRDAGMGAPPVLLDTDAWMAVPPAGWDVWVETLPYKRRVSIRREVRAFEEAGYTVAQLPVAECYQQLAPLAEATLAKYGHAGSAAEHLVTLRRHIDRMGDRARVAVCSRGGGDLVGFCLYYQCGDTIFLRWAGFDYSRLAGAAEYFNLVYYSLIRLAGTAGARWLHAGIKATEAKALRGAQLRPLWLLDLTEGSRLGRHADAVRAHNRRRYEELAADSRTAAALADPDAWRGFC